MRICIIMSKTVILSFILAGINRPLKPEEFMDGNVNFSKKLIDVDEEEKSEAPILFSSSTQATLDNPYGQSKAMAESLFNNFGFNGHAVYVYRLVQRVWQMVQTQLQQRDCHLVLQHRP
jgi:UDP-glucose 4-epimerase